MTNVMTIEPDRGTAIVPVSLLDRAVSSGASIEIIERLMALQERNDANQARKAFDAAMSAAKAEIPVILKNRTVGYDNKDGKGSTSYRHEDLAEIARTVDPILGKHGLSYRFRTTSEVNLPITVTCIVSHRDGHSEENTLMAGKDDSGKKNSIQAIGSTITYLQRYTLKAALGLAASSDDDGGKADDTSGAISEDQLIQIVEMIESVDADRVKFCKFLKVETLADLPAGRFDAAMKALAEHGARK